MPGRVDLRDERARAVGEVVLLEERLHLGRDLGVAVGRKVGEEVVLDLVREVAAHQVHRLGAGDVGAAEHLADVPLALGLALDGALLEGLDALGEVAAQDDGVGPQVARDVGGEVGGQGGQERARGDRQQRVDDVVLGRLLADLAQHLLGAAAEVGVLGLLLGDDRAELEVVGGDAVLEEDGVDEAEHRLGERRRGPRLVLVDAHDAVAEVVVLADDVGVGVVELVVAVLPLLGRRGHVPLPGAGVDLGVAHPVPLAVEDVVADLHVVEDLGDAEAEGAEHPRRRERAEEQHRARAELELALGVDDAADVGGVGGAAGVEDLLADGVELDADLLDVGLGEVRDRAVLAEHGLLLDRGHVRISFSRPPLVEQRGTSVSNLGLGQWSMWQGPAAALMQVCTFTSPLSPGTAVVMAPLRRSRTLPSRSGMTQPMQMPMRHPLGINMPAASAASRIGRGSVEVEGRAGGEGHGAAVAGLDPSGAELLGGEGDAGRLVVRRKGVEQARRATGEGLALGQVGHQVREVVDGEDAVLVVVPRDEADRAGGVEGLEVADEDRVGVAGRDVDDHDVVVGAAGGPQHALVGAREEVAQHADDRRDARPRGDHEELAARGREHELAGRLLEVHQRAGAGLVHEVVADQAVGDGLDGDRDAAVAARTVGQGVRPPLAYAVDVDADAEVLAGDVARPVGTGADDDRRRVGGLGVDGLDATAQVGTGAQGGEEVHEVGGEVGRRGRLRDADQVVAQASALSGAARGRLESRGHRYQCPRRGPRCTCPAHVNRRLDSCSQRTKHDLRSADATPPCAPRHTIPDGCRSRSSGRRRAAHPARRGRRQRRAPDHRRGAQLRGRVERTDGRGHPQRRAARAGRLPHPRLAAGRPTPPRRRRSRAPTSSAAARPAPDVRSRRCSPPTGSAPAPRGARWPTRPSTPGSTRVSSRASPSWSSPTSTSCRRPRSPATPTSWRAPAASASATSSASRGRC